MVEIAPTLRGGGHAVDFRSDAHLTVLERMGILDELRALATGGIAWTFVDENGNRVAGLPPEFAGGEVEMTRGDLSRVLYEHTKDSTEYLFRDSIASLDETADGVHVTFESGEARTFDLVIGADGLHSNVRRLAFGPEERFSTHLGYYVARWEVPNHLGIGQTQFAYNVPGKMAGLAGDPVDAAKADALMFSASERLDYDRRDIEQQKKILADVFAGMGWETPRLVDAIADAPDLYFDSISRIDMKNWSAGRVALAGDAAYGATIGGMGTGSAVVGAYVLAGELATAGGDHTTAFTRYEKEMRDFVTECQQSGEQAGAFLAPPTSEAIEERNRMFNDPATMEMMLRQGQEIAAAITLENY